MREIALSMLRLAVAGGVAFAAMIGSVGLLPVSATELPPSLEGEFFTAEHIPPPDAPGAVPAAVAIQSSLLGTRTSPLSGAAERQRSLSGDPGL